MPLAAAILFTACELVLPILASLPFVPLFLARSGGGGKAVAE